MTERSQEVPRSHVDDRGDEAIEEIRRDLTLGKRRLVVNQQVLFKHASALPPGKRTAVLIAGWGPVVLFPFVPILYFFDWRYSLLALFLGIFWAGMGRKFAQAAVLRQCATDGGFLKSALSAGLVRTL